jgi:hypothetical protein
VSNTIRLLACRKRCSSARDGKISEGHTRPLLMLADRLKSSNVLFKEIMLKRLTVRDSRELWRAASPPTACAKRSICIRPRCLEMERLAAWRGAWHARGSSRHRAQREAAATRGRCGYGGGPGGFGKVEPLFGGVGAFFVWISTMSPLWSVVSSGTSLPLTLAAKTWSPMSECIA